MKIRCASPSLAPSTLLRELLAHPVLSSSITDAGQVERAQAHRGAGAGGGNVGAGEAEERGGVGIGGDDIVAGDDRLCLPDVVEAAAARSVRDEDARGVDDGEGGTEERRQVGEALRQVGMQAAAVLDETHEVLHPESEHRQVVSLGDGHVDQHVGIEGVAIDRPLA